MMNRTTRLTCHEREHLESLINAECGVECEFLWCGFRSQTVHTLSATKTVDCCHFHLVLDTTGIDTGTYLRYNTINKYSVETRVASAVADVALAVSTMSCRAGNANGQQL